jgi:hypothetical protein
MPLPTVVRGPLALVLTAACSACVFAVRPTGAAGVQRGPGGQRASAAGSKTPGAACAPPAAGANQAVAADLSTFAGGPLPPDQAARINQVIDGLCFGLEDPQQNDSTFRGPESEVLADFRLQTELRMHATDPRGLAPGQGMIVAKIRNNGQSGRGPRRWGPGGVLPARQDAYLWFGRSGGNAPYALVLVRTGPQTFRRLSPVGRWAQNDTTRWNKALASWDEARAPKHVHTGPARDGLEVRRQAATSNAWLACAPGCCTTSGVFAD